MQKYFLYEKTSRRCYRFGEGFFSDNPTLYDSLETAEQKRDEAVRSFGYDPRIFGIASMNIEYEEETEPTGHPLDLVFFWDRAKNKFATGGHLSDRNIQLFSRKDAETFLQKGAWFRNSKTEDLEIRVLQPYAEPEPLGLYAIWNNVLQAYLAVDGYWKNWGQKLFSYPAAVAECERLVNSPGTAYKDGDLIPQQYKPPSNKFNPNPVPASTPDYCPLVEMVCNVCEKQDGAQLNIRRVFVALNEKFGAEFRNLVQVLYDAEGLHRPRGCTVEYEFSKVLMCSPYFRGFSVTAEQDNETYFIGWRLR